MPYRVPGFRLPTGQGLCPGRDWVASFCISLAVFFCFNQSQSQAATLHGRIVQTDGRPIVEATVEWVQRSLSTKTGSDGGFFFNGNAAMQFQARPLAKNHFARHSHFVSFNLLGATLTQKPNFHILNLHAKASGLFYASAQKSALSKRSAKISDTLRIHKTGFETRIFPIDQEAAGNLGDIILTPIATGSDICAQQQNMRTSDGHEVIVCEALYTQMPRIRLPTPPVGMAYAVMTSDAFITTDGLTYPYARSEATDTEMRRHASALYAIRIQNGKVESFHPTILFDEALFMAPLIGRSFEGLISAKSGNGRYELIPTLPIRLQVTAETYTGTAKPASLYAVKAKITNFSQAQAASDGTCMPALRSHGARMPFASDDGLTLLIGRVPSMHAFGDNELVIEIRDGEASLGSLMSIEWFFTPLDMIRNTLGLTGTYSGVGHGSPGSIPMMELNPASGGGSACEAE